MFATEQTAVTGLVQHRNIASLVKHSGIPPMKHALQLEAVKSLPSYHLRAALGARAVAKDSARIQGGNWSMQGFRRSGHVHDAGECQMTIAEFMAEHGQPHGSSDA